MRGAAKDLMYMCMKALREAYADISSLKCGRAAENVSSGKSDTYGLDQATEEVIKHHVSDYDSDIVLITEETGKMYHGERGLEPTQIVLISDPTDRSIKMKEFIDKRILENDSNRNKYVRDVLNENIDKWEKELGYPTLSGSSGSITAIKDRRILFSVMMNYVTGEMFVSSPLGNKYGNIEKKFENFNDVSFRSQSDGEKFATFIGKKGYDENLEKCELGLSKENCVDPWAPGPMRILQLSDLNKTDDISAILCNGEKIGEWIGWLSWVKYAHNPDEPDEHSLKAYRIFFESPRTQYLVTVAPAPHYSIFRDEEGETRINLNMMFQLEDPSHYRETMIIVPVHNLRTISRIKSRGRNQHELEL